MFNKAAQFITINVFWVVFVCFFTFEVHVLAQRTKTLTTVSVKRSNSVYFNYHIKNFKLMNHLLENYAYAKYFSCCVQLKMNGGKKMLNVTFNGFQTTKVK